MNYEGTRRYQSPTWTSSKDLPPYRSSNGVSSVLKMAMVCSDIVFLVLVVTLGLIFRFLQAFDPVRLTSLSLSELQKIDFDYVDEHDDLYDEEAVKNYIKSNKMVGNVSDYAFYPTLLLIPITMLLCGEAVLHVIGSDQKRPSSRFPPIVYRLWKILIVGFLFGLFSLSVLVDSWKIFSGTPRPYSCFLWNLDGFGYCNCSSDDDVPDQVVLECDDSDEARDALKSYPSAHAALATYAAIYIWIYLGNVAGKGLKITASSIGLGLSILALYVGYSRRQYYYNHSDDILVGHLTGLVYAVAMGYYAIIRESNKDGTEMEPPLELIRTEWTGDSKPFTTNGTQRSTQQPALNDDAHIHEHSGAGMIPRAYPIQRPAGEINRSFRDESQEIPQTRYY